MMICDLDGKPGRIHISCAIVNGFRNYVVSQYIHLTMRRAKLFEIRIINTIGIELLEICILFTLVQDLLLLPLCHITIQSSLTLLSFLLSTKNLLFPFNLLHAMTQIVAFFFFLLTLFLRGLAFQFDNVYLLGCCHLESELAQFFFFFFLNPFSKFPQPSLHRPLFTHTHILNLYSLTPINLRLSSITLANRSGSLGGMIRFPI